MEAASVERTSLGVLRELIGSTLAYQSPGAFPCSHLSSGIPRGAISALSGSGKTGLVTDFLAENPELKVAWVEDQLSVYPWAMSQRHAGLRRILFAECGDDSPWVLSQILRSQLFQVVVFSSGPGVSFPGACRVEPSRPTCPSDGAARPWRAPVAGTPGSGSTLMQEKTLRGLQLAAERSQVALLLLMEQQPVNAWAVSLQLKVGREVEPGLCPGSRVVEPGLCPGSRVVEPGLCPGSRVVEPGLRIEILKRRR